MAELVVIGYPSEAEAREVMGVLRSLERDLVLKAAGTAIVARSANGDLRLITPHHATGARSETSNLWGATLGDLFFHPAGEQQGDVELARRIGDLADVGIADEFKAQVFALLRPGGAALVVLFDEKAPDRTLEALAPYGGTALRTSLSHEVDAYLQEAQ
jgi:uncharacterized membrane protein